MVYKKLFVLLIFSIVLAGCLDDNGSLNGDGPGNDVFEGPGASVYRKLSEGDSFDALEEELSGKGFSVKNAAIYEDMAIVNYTQSANADPEEIYANWAYIFGQMVRLAPSSDIERNFIISDFDDGETIMIGATTNTIKSFLEGKIDAWTFIYYINLIPVTEGPQVWTGE